LETGGVCKVHDDKVSQKKKTSSGSKGFREKEKWERRTDLQN